MNSRCRRSVRCAGAVALVAGASLAAIWAPAAWQREAGGSLGTFVAPAAWARAESEAPPADPAVASAPDAVTTGTLFADDPLRSLAQALRARERELDERQAQLEAEAKRLETLRAELDATLSRMQDVFRRMETAAAQVDAQQQAELKRWVRIYEAMAPEQAARVLQDLEPMLARSILSSMDARKAGRILNAIDPQRAVSLSADLGSASR